MEDPSRREQHEPEPAIVAARRALGDWQEAVAGEVDLTLPMPWKQLSAAYCGWPLGKLVFIGARSSEHKSTFLRTCCVHVASLGHRSLFWSLEDSNEEIAARTIADAVRLTTLDLGTGTVDGQKLTKAQATERHRQALSKIDGAPWSHNLRLIDEPMPKLSRVMKVLEAEADAGTKLFGLDYFQLAMPEHGEPTPTFVRSAAYTLSTFAKRRKVCVMATSQLDKVGSLASKNDGRIPEAEEMLFGSILKQCAFAVIMIGKTNPSTLVGCVEKFKNAPAGNVTFLLGVDPAYDRLDEVV